MTESRIFRKNDRIVFQGSFRLSQLQRSLAGLHQAIQEAGYVDVVLDFSDCETAFAPPMLAICAQVAKLHYEGIDFSLVLPKNDKLQKVFRNTNWAYFLDPRKYEPSTFRGYTQVPATLYSSPEDQYKAVNRIVNAILGAIPNIARKDLAALEWAVNELTDNVLVHSQSPVGGLVQVSTFQRDKKKVEFIVADAGIGIPNSLRLGHPELTSDSEALDRAIREGVTRDKNLGQGNGLFGTYQICSRSKGSFQVESGYGKLSFYEPAGLKIGLEGVPYEGTLVVAEIDFSIPDLLQEALKFNGRVTEPFDYVESHYEDTESRQVIFRVADETSSFGSRVAGRPLKNRLSNLARMCPTQEVVIDFTDVALVSSSFADELIGKLFAEFGPMEFMTRFRLVGVSTTVQQLIDRAISQRLANGPSK